jgi:putative NADH-flavin reductase
LRIVILGATGAVGRHVVRFALDADYEVVAFVRNAAKMTVHHPHLHLVEGTLSDLARLKIALCGVVAVVSALGVSHTTPDSQPSQQLPILDSGGHACLVKAVCCQADQPLSIALYWTLSYEATPCASHVNMITISGDRMSRMSAA